MVLAGSALLSLIIPHWDRKCFLKSPNGALSGAVLGGYLSQLLRVSRAPGCERGPPPVNFLYLGGPPTVIGYCEVWKVTDGGIIELW